MIALVKDFDSFKMKNESGVHHREESKMRTADVRLGNPRGLNTVLGQALGGTS